MNPVMNKAQLVDAVRDRCNGTSRKTVNEILDAFLATVQDTVADGTDISLTGFGRFSRSERSARTGRNPQTGQTIQIPAGRQPSFKAGKAFKDAVK